MAKLQLQIQIKFPWWTKVYIFVLKMLQDVGLLDVDVDVAQKFIVARARWRCERNGKWEYFDLNAKQRVAPRNFIVR